MARQTAHKAATIKVHTAANASGTLGVETKHYVRNLSILRDSVMADNTVLSDDETSEARIRGIYSFEADLYFDDDPTTGILPIWEPGSTRNEAGQSFYIDIEDGFKYYKDKMYVKSMEAQQPIDNVGVYRVSVRSASGTKTVVSI